MKNKTAFFLLPAFYALVSCGGLKPKGFDNYYTAKYTGLDTLIDIRGYYLYQRECDENFQVMCMFYNDGLFTVATGENLDGMESCFKEGGKNNLCQYPLWGTYILEGKLIQTQVIRQEGIGFCIINRSYKILPGKKLVNISDYIIPRNTNLGNMFHYPSYFKNECPVELDFYPLETKRDSMECPLLKKSYFHGK